ncbi:ketopantoate reductase PanE/ApbA C terminal-domain-containing protein [Amylostereum chailletii]|nr:ketopantoate reductase PanE/ApbA C terminal-domain-containing protein [Amylostereum chailletii]
MRFHVLGLGPIGTLISHHLRLSLDQQHAVVHIHKNLQQLRKAMRTGSSVTIERDGVTQTSAGYRGEVYEALVQMRQDARTVREANATDAQQGEVDKERARKSTTEPASQIESLIVTIKAPAVLPALRQLSNRLTPNSTIVLLHNGMGVYEQVIAEVFRNPDRRPHFILASNNHGAWNQGYLHTVHSGVGSIEFGIVPDPRGRDFETQRAENEEPWAERRLSLDSIATPQDAAASPYTSLRNTVAALSSLSALQTSWQPISRVIIAMKRKVVVNSAINSLTAIMGCRNGELLHSRHATRIMRRVCEEAALVYALQANEDLRLSGHPLALPSSKSLSSSSKSMLLHRLPSSLKARALEDECLRVSKITEANTSSMLTDIRSSKRTEIAYLNGYLLGLGRAHGLKMPVNNTLLNMVRMREEISLDRIMDIPNHPKSRSLPRVVAPPKSVHLSEQGPLVSPDDLVEGPEIAEVEYADEELVGERIQADDIEMVRGFSEAVLSPYCLSLSNDSRPN